MYQQKKIRVGLVGLNAPYTGAPTGTNWTANAHLPYLRATSKYEIVALQNSSVDRAKAAIKAYELDASRVKAYGSAEDIANDPDVDLVVTSIRVDRHGGSAIPAIKAGKDIYVEWPVEANVAKAREMYEIARSQKVRSVIGMQGSLEPAIGKVKAVVESGAIGNVDSSTYVHRYPSITNLSSAIDYFADRKVGGNYFTIIFGHLLETIHPVLGPVSYHHSRLINQYPEINVSDPITKSIITIKPNDVPTHVMLDAVLSSGAHLSLTMHNAPSPSPDANPAKEPSHSFPAIDWRIFGTKGEIHITSTHWAISTGAAGTTQIKVLKADTGLVEEVPWEDAVDEWKDLPLPARNIARLYEAFADGRDGKDGKEEWYPDLEHALGTHELIEAMYKENGF